MSNQAKGIELGENDIICPQCNSLLNIPNELEFNEYIQCNKCDAVIPNPLYWSGKIITCFHCGYHSELPKNLENTLILNCDNCKNDIINIYSNEYNPISCPHCQFENHISKEFVHEKYLNCPNCGTNFENTKRIKKEPAKAKIKEEFITLICPNCSKEQQFAKKFQNDTIVSCIFCHTEFDNPILTKNDKLYKYSYRLVDKSTKPKLEDELSNIKIPQSIKLFFIVIGVIFFLYLFGAFDNFTGNVSSDRDFSKDSVSNSYSMRYYVNTDTYVGTSKSGFDQMVSYSIDGDNQALKQLAYNGQIDILTNGTHVFLISSHFSYAIIRKEGSTRRLYINSEFITKE